ncbi:hypothetical protein J6590_071933 [Homalodisca vitripennis]|nr:hypothetical protein J6590_071933 [Homalodisca vitripennis]
MWDLFCSGNCFVIQQPCSYNCVARKCPKKQSAIAGSCLKSKIYRSFHSRSFLRTDRQVCGKESFTTVESLELECRSTKKLDWAWIHLCSIAHTKLVCTFVIRVLIKHEDDPGTNFPITYTTTKQFMRLQWEYSPSTKMTGTLGGSNLKWEPFCSGTNVHSYVHRNQAVYAITMGVLTEHEDDRYPWRLKLDVGTVLQRELTLGRGADEAESALSITKPVIPSLHLEFLRSILFPFCNNENHVYSYFWASPRYNVLTGSIDK